MKRALFIIAGIFATVLAVTFGLRMTSDAMAVIVGILLGMLATIPTSLVLLYMIRNRDTQQAQMQQQHPNGQYPPVVVVNSTPNGGYGGMAQRKPTIISASPYGRTFLHCRRPGSISNGGIK